MSAEHPAPGAAPTDGAAVGSPPTSWLGRFARLLLALAILGVGAGLSFHWLANRPVAQRRPPQAEARLVEVIRVRLTPEKALVDAMGTVIAARSVQLAPRVSGQIVEVSAELVPGGSFRAGEPVVKIDPADYRLAVQQQEAEVRRLTAVLKQQESEIAQRETEIARAESALKIEMGEQSVAEREYELLGETVTQEDLDLVLRQPQLKTAQANFEAARAARAAAEAALEAARASRDAASVALRKTELDEERTTVRAPFNATVQSKFVDLGSQVSAGTAVASLAGTDEYWIRLSVSTDELRWISIPGFNGEAGAAVQVYHESAWGAGASRAGTVLRVMAELEPEGRMARLLVSVKDPLEVQAADRARHALILGSYVRARIRGRDLGRVASVPRTALRNGSQVWVMTPEGALDIREVTVAWSGNEHVFVSEGLADGDLLVTSNLAAPVQGMALRTADQAPAPPQGGPEQDVRTAGHDQ